MLRRGLDIRYVVASLNKGGAGGSSNLGPR